MRDEVSEFLRIQGIAQLENGWKFSQLFLWQSIQVCKIACLVNLHSSIVIYHVTIPSTSQLLSLTLYISVSLRVKCKLSNISLRTCRRSESFISWSILQCRYGLETLNAAAILSLVSCVRSSGWKSSSFPSLTRLLGRESSAGMSGRIVEGETSVQKKWAGFKESSPVLGTKDLVRAKFYWLARSISLMSNNTLFKDP